MKTVKRQLFFIFFLLLTSCEFVKSIDGASACNTYTAIICEDNGFLTKEYGGEKRHSLPEFVNNSIDEFLIQHPTGHLLSIYKKSYSEDVYVLTLKMSYEFSPAIFYFIFSVDAKCQMVTVDPPYINGKWMNNSEEFFLEEFRLLENPLLFFDDIDGDGIWEIVVKERTHNGTMYDAVVYNYFRIDFSDMSLRKSLSVERKCFYLFDSNCVFFRFFDDNKGILSCYMSCYGEMKKIGDVYVEQIGDRYVIVKTTCNFPMYEGFLVTGAPVDSESFFNEGYTFVY